MLSSGHVYRDYSTEAERAADKAAAERDKRAYRFRRKELSEQTRRLSSRRRAARIALRFQVPAGRMLVLHDLIKGDVEFSTDEIGDFVIVRPDGSPLYNFASVVDDVDMEITHVVRADEHLSNTFPAAPGLRGIGRQVAAVCPCSLCCGARVARRRCRSGSSPSTRSRAFWFICISTSSGAIFRTRVVNYLARLGWSYDASQEIFARQELIEKFTLEKVNSSPASHDQDKLFWIEGEWMRTLPLEQKVAGVVPFLKREGLVGEPLGARESSADRSGHRGAGRPAQGLFGYPQAGPVFLYPGADVTSRTP